MGVLVSNDSQLDTLVDQAEVEQIVATCLKLEEVPRPVEVSVSFVDADEMHELNREWRGVDKTTDVLSFECDDPFDESVPADAELELGDIILAPTVIAAQAPQFNNTPADELRLMLVHGMMHLLGYDHMVEDEAICMEQHEEAILKDLAVQRGVDAAKVSVGPSTRHEND